MKNIKLIKLLKTFSQAEYKKFRDFVRSPYFNKNKNVIKLNEKLSKFYPAFDDAELDEKNLYRHVFGNLKFDYFRIKNLVSDLYNLAIEFIRLHPNIHTAFDKDYNMLVELRTRKLWNLHKKAVTSLADKFNSTEIRDSVFLYNNYLLTMEYHLSNVLEKPNSIKMIFDEFLSFYEFSMLNLLKFYNLMMHISKENNIKLDMKMLDDVIRYIENNAVSSNPTIEAYKNLVLLAFKRDEKYYFSLKEYFISQYKNISYEDSYYIIMYLTGYCTDRYNLDGDRRFIKESCDLLELSYRNNMVTLGELMYPNFINYVKVYTRAGRADLALKFISDYKDKLPVKLQQSCINLANAYIEFSKKKYSAALGLISKVSLPWIIMKIQVKLMQIELCYHLGYYEDIRSLAESFKKSLLKDESISEDYRISILSFIKHILQLVNINELNDKKAREQEISLLRQSVESGQPNHFGIRLWLEDAVNEAIK